MLNKERLMTMQELADYCQITLDRAYTLAREGILPPGVIVKLGRQLRCDPEQLEKWVKNGGQNLPGGWKKETKE